MIDSTSFESWTRDHVSKVGQIVRALKAEHPVAKDSIETLKIAVQIHRNIILQQGLHAGGTKKPNPLEMIAIEMMGKK